MKYISCLTTLSLFYAITALHAQVTLQPWMEVFGSTNGEQLGKYVTGIVPSANLPFKAAVSKVGSTGIYQLQDSTQTTPQRIFLGENLLTGDLNNDGFKDVVVGKSVNGYDTVFIYWGTTTGIDTLNPLRIPGANQYDGLKPGCIGDLNNDGEMDLVLRAPNFNAARGRVYIFLNPVATPTPAAVVTGDSMIYQLGIATTIGDVNNDGREDLILRGNRQLGSSSTFFDYVDIYWGRMDDTLNVTNRLRLKTKYINSAGLAAFDVNGDGKDDLLWTTQDSLSDWINVHFGRTAFDTIPDLRLQNPGVGTFGFAITSGGDMNCDGYKDVVVGCPRASITSGIVLVYGGGPAIDPFVDAARSMGSESGFGASVAALGDLNGDGLADIIAGAPNDPFFNDRGYWGVFKGDSTIRVTAIKEEPLRPDLFALEQAYPNPFNPVTTIDYVAKTSAHIALTVFDGLGREITKLVDDDRSPGIYEAHFDGRFHASGVYYYRMTATTEHGTIFTDTKRMILVK